MVEDNKTQTSPQAKSGSKSAIKYSIGFFILAAGLALWWIFRSNFIGLLKGCIGPFLALIGIIVLAIAKE